jgi:hypothetical protein
MSKLHILHHWYQRNTHHMKNISGFPHKTFLDFMDKALTIQRRHRAARRNGYPATEQTALLCSIDALRSQLSGYIQTHAHSSGLKPYVTFLDMLNDVDDWLRNKRKHVRQGKAKRGETGVSASSRVNHRKYRTVF